MLLSRFYTQVHNHNLSQHTTFNKDAIICIAIKKLVKITEILFAEETLVIMFTVRLCR